MKRLKLLLAAVAAMVGLCVQAQGWIPSTVGAGMFDLRNVGTNQLFDQGNDWGTRASISQNGKTVELVPVGDDFHIRVYGVGNLVETPDDKKLRGVEYLGNSDIYTDQSPNKLSTWKFVNVGTDTEPVYNIISADNHGGGSGAYLTAEGGSSTIVGPGDNGDSNFAKWKLEPKIDFESTRASIIATMSTATLDNPMDVTGLIGNPDFNLSDQAELPIYWAMASSNKNLCGGKKEKRCAESWHATFNLSQVIKNIPNGKYELTAQAAMSGSEAYVYANEKKSLFKTMDNGVDNMDKMSTLFSQGFYPVSVTVIVTDGKLTIGAKCDRSDNWCVWTEFRLKYYGIDLSALQGLLADKVAAAQAIAAGTIPTAAYNALNAVVTEYNKTYSTAEGYETAISKIEEATTNALALVAPYATYKAAVDDAAIVGLDASEQNAAVELAKTVEEIEACTANLKAAVAALPSFDITTFTIKNPTPVANQDIADNWEGDEFGDSSDGVSEYWNKSGANFHQTIANLPAGRYRLTVIALQRSGMKGTVYAGNRSTVIAQVSSDDVNLRSEAAAWFDNGNGRNYVYFRLPEAGNVTIGLTADATTSDHWTVWRSFELETFEEGVAQGYMSPGWTTLKENAQAALTDAAYVNVTGDEKTALETAIAANPSTGAEYEVAIEALNIALAAFTAAKKNYDLYVSELAVANAISSDITTTVPTTSDKALEAFQDLNVKLYNYVENRDNYPCSLTSKIGEFSTWTRTGTVDGVKDNKYTANTDQHWSGERRPYYEQPDNGWSHDSWTSHYTKSYKLPAGSYVLKVAARASESPKTSAKITCTATTMNMPIPNLGGNGYGIKTNGNASFKNDIANEGFANNNNGYGWVWNYLPFTLNEETEVTMTIEAEGNGHHEWFSVCDAELLSTTDIATDVTYDETANNTITDVDVANVTINRTIHDGFNTVVFPFDLTASQVINTFGFESKVYTYSENSEDANNVTIKFWKLKDGTISANVPVLVWATYPHQIMINGVNVVAPTSDVKVEGNFFDFVGTYAPINPIPAGDYFVGYNTEKPDGAIFKSEGATSINAFRAYIHAKTAGARVTNLYIDGVETTDIDVLEAVGISNGKIYNLNGQEVKKAQKGIYIVNGKKLLVK